MVKKRNPLAFILLSVVTLGIYPFVSFCIISSEINMICDGDDNRQMNYFFAALLGLVTLGIYPYVWMYKAVSRLEDNAYRYGTLVNVRHSATEVLLWQVLGLFIVVGPFIAWWYFIEDINAYADAYGYVEAAAYTNNLNERNYLSQHVAAQSNNYANMQSNAPYLNNGGNNRIMTSGYNNQGAGSVNPPIDDVPPTRPKDGYQPRRPGAITGTVGMYKDYSFPIQFGEELVIGVDPSQCNIVITDRENCVSRRHCSVRYNAENENYIVTDYSTNGTFIVDGTRLEKGIESIIRKGTIIYVGNRENCFRLG